MKRPVNGPVAGPMLGQMLGMFARVALLVVSTLPLVSTVSAAPAKGPDKNHQDAFMPGDAAENEIAREVRHQLVLLPYYGVFDDLAFNVNGSTVTLLGAVTQPSLKDNAEKTVKRVKGVTQVVDQIEVLPLSPMDDQIRRAVYRAIYGLPGIDTRYGYRSVPSIHILVKNGHLTLEGVVANQSDKNLINITANGVPNVFSVTNDLQVETAGK
jgi:hyperosmotically inducible protein